MEIHYNDKLLVLSTNISIGWKWLKVENTIAYYDTAKINGVKSFKEYIEKMLNKVSLSCHACEGLF